MLLDNTRGTIEAYSGQPGQFFRARHVQRLGAWDAAYRGNLGGIGLLPGEAQVTVNDVTSSLSPEILKLINEGLIAVNAPVSVSTPVAAGITGGTMLMIAGLLYAMSKR